ncbi:MAG: protein-tyrosine-phosphatase, partial [Sphingomonadaceae bacterium]|nr:protein-tyrosine-phosphatase [Sphingomonadaceae bacterium]
FSLAEIEAKWGSIDQYLEFEIGLTKADIARLRVLYTE